jgi:hypothetical protein
MTRSEIEAELYRTLGYSASPPTETTTRLRSFVNRVYRDLLARPGMDRLRQRTLTLSLAANSPEVALPQAATRVLALTDATTGRRLVETTLPEIRRRDPGRTVTGPPEAFAVVGYASPVARDPADASPLYAVSTSASDTQNLTVEVVRAGGARATETKALTGTTAIAVGPSDTVAVTKAYLWTAAVGAVSLREDSGTGTVLGTIPAGAQRARYTRLQIWPTPAAAVDLVADLELAPSDLLDDQDEPLLPEPFHDLLVYGAAELELSQPMRQSGTTSFLARQYARRLGDLLHYLHTTSVGGRRAARPRWSPLGPWYPPEAG